MTLEEIRLGIIRLLRNGGTGVENITGEDVTQAEGMPLLHVQLEPLSFSPAAAGHHRDKEILVDIACMEKLVTSNRSIYAMLEKLDSIFSPYFRIGDRAFTCTAQMGIEDGIGHYRFTMIFTDLAPVEVPEPVAEKLQVKWRDEDGITRNQNQLPAESEHCDPAGQPGDGGGSAGRQNERAVPDAVLQGAGSRQRGLDRAVFKDA